MIRPYQQEALDGIQEQFSRHGATLAVMATGTGKTQVFAHLIKQRLALGRTMVIAHREELIDQAAKRIEQIVQCRVDVEMAEHHADSDEIWHNGKAPVVVASVQSLCSGTRMQRFDPMQFATVIYDEAHHCCANTYRRVFEHFETNPSLKTLGVTATPDRHDEEALGQIFESVAYDYEIIDAVIDGWLVRPLCRTIKLQGLDLSGVRTTAGEFNAKDLAIELARNQNLEQIAAATIEHSENRQTLVFADSLTESEYIRNDDGEVVEKIVREGNAPKLTVMLNGHKKGSARLVHGGTNKDERRSIIDDYRANRFQYLVNVGVATEGFDAPDIACVVLGRPTKSRALCSQMIGRGTRPASAIADLLNTLPNDVARRQTIAESGKPNLLIVDFVDNTERHDLIHPADILGGRVSAAAVDEVSDRCQAMPVDLISELDLVDCEIRHNDELARAARNREGVKARTLAKNKDPFAIYELSRRERRGWEQENPLLPEQREKLERWKIKHFENLNAAEANQIIDEVRSRARRGLCTLNMAKQLRRRGYDPDMPFDEAKAMMKKWFGE
jgi:superfamily II DNA or RNA helicase